MTLLGVDTQPARANSDPASDVLPSQQLFLPVSTPISPSLAARLVTTISDANRRGYEIRVAVIAAPTDLGGVTALWAKPKLYARFLGEELRSVYTGRLLIAMPKGFGFFAAAGSSAREQREANKLTAGQGPDAFIRSTIDAVTRLEAAVGRSARHSEADGGSGISLALILGVASAAALAAAAAGSWLWRRRRRSARRAG